MINYRPGSSAESEKNSPKLNATALKAFLGSSGSIMNFFSYNLRYYIFSLSSSKIQTVEIVQ